MRKDGKSTASCLIDQYIGDTIKFNIATLLGYVFSSGSPMPYKVKAIANYFLDLAESQKNALSPIKLQKLVYYAHGLCLAAYGRPLLDESIQAWTYGPVVPSLYQAFKEFGSGAITARARESFFEGGKIQIWYPSIQDCSDPEQNRQTKDLLNFV